MKYLPFAPLLGSGLAVLALGLISLPAAAQLIVSPSVAANREGNSNNGFPFSGGANRYQQIYAASEFSTLTGPTRITQIAFRPNFDSTPFITNFASIQFDLSTSQSPANQLKSSFSDNVGADDTIVRSGALTLSSAVTGPAGGPKDFDIVVNLTTPFLYNPANGNLLLDIRKFSAENTNQVFDAEDGSGQSSRNVSTDVNGNFPTIPGGSIALVTQFTFQPAGSVPEPGSAALLAGIGVAGIGVFLRRRKP